MPRVSKSTRRMRIRKDLLEQLKRSEKDSNLYADLVEDYLALWDFKEDLKSEVKKYGTRVDWQNGSQSGRKTNSALADLRAINKQMISILKSLGLDTPLSSDIDLNHGDKKDEADDDDL
jgi:phage terminase small subunit